MKTHLLVALAALVVCAAALAADPQVELKTNMGTITLQLYADKAPKTVENFLQYVREGQYKGTIFHRVMPGFMIQAGGFTAGFVEKKTRDPIQNEANNGLRNEVGTVAMARRSDPHSASAQFFINVSDNRALNFAPGNAGYAVFGKVAKGMDIVNKIAAADTGPGPVPPHENVPRKPIVIEDAKIVVHAEKAVK